MGSIVGGIVGGVGSLFGSNKASSQDLTGFNYLTGKNGTQPFVNTGNAANTEEGNLLGLNGAAGTAAGNQALGNYLNSDQYNFALNQGTRAVTGSAAARGLLNSGATAKVLTQYGQGLAGQQFGNYLGSVQNLGQQGLTAAGQIGEAGTTGGVNAGSQTANPNGPFASAVGLGSSLATNIFGLL